MSNCDLENKKCPCGTGRVTTVIPCPAATRDIHEERSCGVIDFRKHLCIMYVPRAVNSALGKPASSCRLRGKCLGMLDTQSASASSPHPGDDALYFVQITFDFLGLLAINAGSNRVKKF